MELRLDIYKRVAEVLRRQELDPNARVFHELMSDGLVWSDEKSRLSQGDVSYFSPMRVIWHRRTLMICEEPARFEDEWNALLEACPEWIGFRPERLAANPELAKMRRDGNRRMIRDCIRMEREERQSRNET